LKNYYEKRKKSITIIYEGEPMRRKICVKEEMYINEEKLKRMKNMRSLFSEDCVEAYCWEGGIHNIALTIDW